MSKKSIAYEKAYQLAIRIVNAYKYLVNQKREFILSKQMLRSGTSIGANLAEANSAISSADFSAKVSIAYFDDRCKALRLMVRLQQQFHSFEEYLSYDDGTDNLYELFNGELIEVPPESGLNVEIATFLLLQLALKLGHQRVRGHGLELEVRGEPRNRYPDLTVIREEHIEQLKRRNTIRLSMAPPVLVVEVVSPGEVQHNRDYVAKRLQYQDVGVLEYWIVDPQASAIWVLELVKGVYREVGAVVGESVVVSPQLGTLELTAADIFAAAHTQK
ncbi:four helix bundle protein [Geitlerinema sp. CS-897]|nr:four helix bundle protein [Geitlerinema sp. CS-897]